jgi:hypothetical protein
MSFFARLLPLALVVLAACSSSPGGEETPDAGGDGLPPDLCNTREEGLNAAECQLTPGVEVEHYISTPGDQDWYSVQLPANAGPRTLVRVISGYKAQSTAVSLAVSLLRADGQSLERKVDAHGQGAPQPVEMLVPYGEPGARVLLLVSDAALVPSRPAFDARSKYFLKVEVLENPDPNEPNDAAAQATPVTLSAAQGGIFTGTATGYIATAGDVDRFSFDVPVGKVLYVHLTGPTLQPPPAYRLAYTLLRPDGTAESEGNMRPQVVPANLATARKVKGAGTWTVVVQGYRAPNDTSPPPGDVRQQYTLEVRVMDEEDPFDRTTPNDTYDKTFTRDLGATPGAAASTSFVGRLGTVGDRDWYSVTLGASTEPTVLRYRLEPLGSGARFEPLPGLVDRQLRVLTRITTSSSLAQQQLDCINRQDVCPKGYTENPAGRALVEALCTPRTAINQPPLCLQSGREEALQGFTGLANFQGAIPVPGHNATVTYFFLVQDDGNDWADDRDYRLTVSWLPDADEVARFQGGAVERPSPAVLQHDPTAATFPAPPADAMYEVGGELTYGYGRLRTEDRVTGRGVRGPDDYDAVASDVDTYAFTLPGGLSAPTDQTWELQWVINHLPDGGLPHQLTLDLEFCDGSRLDGGVCTPVNTGSRNVPLTLAYRADPLRAWHSQGGTLSGLQPLYGLSTGNGATTVTVQPYACACLERRFIQGGTLKVAVSAAERTDYEPVRYTLRTAYTDYPKGYAVDAGITAQCPAPVQDGGIPLEDGGTQPVYTGGCQFTRQP